MIATDEPERSGKALGVPVPSRITCELCSEIEDDDDVGKREGGAAGVGDEDEALDVAGGKDEDNEGGAGEAGGEGEGIEGVDGGDEEENNTALDCREDEGLVGVGEFFIVSHLI